MKKNIIKYGIYILVAVLTFALVIFIMNYINKQKIENTMKKFDAAFESKEKQIIFFASETCHFCQLEKPILKQIVKDYNLDYIDIDASKLSEKQLNKVLKKLDIEYGTPTTVVLENGKPLYKQIGYVDGQDYVDFFIEAGLIKKDSKYLPEKNISFINFDEFKDLNDGIVAIGYSANSDCNDIKKVLSNIAQDKKVTISYYNVAKLNEEEYYATFDYLDEINTKNYKLYEDDKFVYPTILVIKNGKISKVVREKTEKNIIKALGL